jgi:hypothetical protein
MQAREWRRLVEDINADIAGMVRAQQTLREVNDALVQRARNPIEEDFIHADMWDIDPHMPRITQVDADESVEGRYGFYRTCSAN